MFHHSSQSQHETEKCFLLSAHDRLCIVLHSLHVQMYKNAVLCANDEFVNNVFTLYKSKVTFGTWPISGVCFNTQVNTLEH